MASKRADAAAAFLALDLEQWVAATARLLQLEQDAEVDAAIGALSSKNEGTSLRLQVADVTTGLLARTILTLAHRSGGSLPNHVFSTGDIVGLSRVGSVRAAKAAGGASSARDAYEASAVVVAVQKTAIQVALDDRSGAASKGGVDAAPSATGGSDPLSDGEIVRLDKLADDVSFRRVTAVLRDLREHRHGPAGRVLRVLFQPAVAAGAPAVGGGDLPSFARGPVLREAPSAPEGAAAGGPMGDSVGAGSGWWSPLNPGLNHSQKRAIESALRACDVCMIHGPPGTGKTTAVVEYVAQEVARGHRVLACAPSNVAVDNMVERLAAIRVPAAAPAGDYGGAGGGKRAQSKLRPLRIVRLGHPARLSAGVLAHSLEALVCDAEGTSIVGDVRRELNALEAQIRKARGGERKALRGEERELRTEIRKREERVVTSILRSADVVLATNTGAATKSLQRAMQPPESGASSAGSKGSPSFFDVVVIDEVAQATEASCYIPALLGAKLVIAGDHLQLPPTIISEEAARAGLSITLADRMAAKFEHNDRAMPTTETAEPEAVCMLDVQYRMHSAIMKWSSDALYGGRVTAAPAVAAHTLAELPTVVLPASGLVTLSATALSAARAAAAAEISGRIADAEEAAGAAAESDGASASKPGAGAGTPGKRLHVRGAAQPPSDKTLDAVRDLLQPSASDVVVETAALLSPMLLVDTAGCPGMEELKGSDASGAVRESKSNAGEADIVLKHVLALRGLGVPAADIAVVTPYNAQVALISALLTGAAPGVEVKSVDSFQGQEKEAIVISMVRSNREGQIGFLSDFRRMNVAVTRARRHCALVCDSDTVSSDLFLAGLVAYASEHGHVCSAAEYAPGDEPVVVSARGAAARADTTAHRTAKAESRLPHKDATAERKALFLAVRSVLRQFVACLRLAIPAGLRSVDGSAPGPALPVLSLEGRLLSPQVASSCAIASPTGVTRSESELAPVLPTAVLHVQVATGSGSGSASGDSESAAPGNLILSFPPSLTPFQRMMVHAVAERLGLEHSSTDTAGGARILAVKGNLRFEEHQNSQQADIDASGNASAIDNNAAGQSEEDEREWQLLQNASEATWTTERRTVPYATARSVPSVSEVALSASSAACAASLVPASTLPEREPAPQPLAASVVATSSSTSVSSALKSPPPLISPAAAMPAVPAGPASPANILLAEAAAARKERLRKRKPAAGVHAADDDLITAVVVGAAASGKKTGQSTAAKALPPVATAAGQGHEEGEKREFGLRVGSVKPVPAVPPPHPTGSSKQKKKGGSSTRKGGAAESGDDADMALLDAMVASSKLCAALRCKTSIQTISSLCKHCRMRFCYEHGLPESHGCGGDARAAARAAWIGGAGMAAITGAAPSSMKKKPADS